jgi:hypothetical protein
MKLSHIISEKARVQNASDSEEFQYLQDAANIIAEVLDISDIDIQITFDPPYDLDPSQEGATLGLGRNPKKIFIFVDKGLSTGDNLRILAHEMVHAQQLATGKLSILDFKNGKISGEWKGKKFDDLRYSDRNPWELEARTKERQLQRMVIDQIGNFVKE